MMCPNELAASITAVAVSLANGKSEDEINLLGSIFSQLGDTLETIAAQRALCQSSEN